MNETVLLKLKIIIERAVRPVKAPLSRKKKMREELLAHVTGVFEEEISHHLDEATALFEVEKRFGDPIELSRKLQETVSTINRVEWHLAQWLQTRPAESLLHRATRVGVMSFVFQLILTVPAIIFVVLYLSKISKMNVLMQGVIGVAFTSVAFGVMSFAVTLLSNGMQQTLFNSKHPSFIKGGLLILVSCLVPVFLPLDIAMGLLPFLSPADCVVVGASTLRATWPAILLSPIVFVIVTKLIADEKRYAEEWATLQID